MGIRESLALNLREYRRVQDLSQEELAHRADIDRTYMSAIERCRYSASVDVLAKLAQALGVEAADLLKTPPDPPPETPAQPAKPAKPRSAKRPARKKAKPKRSKA